MAMRGYAPGSVPRPATALRKQKAKRVVVKKKLVAKKAARKVATGVGRDAPIRSPIRAAGVDWARFEEPLPHPGEILAEDYMAPMGLTPGALAKLMGLSGRQRIERLVRAEQGVSADTALRLGVVLGTSAELWMNLQSAHDMSKAAIASRVSLAKLDRYGAS